jgi:LuxR family maltose regulon positive regulatory protein
VTLHPPPQIDQLQRGQRESRPVMSEFLPAGFEPPPCPRDLAERPALLGRLARGLEGRLTLVSAPAGYGKTTLLSAWVRQSRHPVCWLALDEGHDDLARFVRLMVLAVQSVAPTAGESTLRLARQEALPPPAAIAATLTDDLEAMPGSLVIVIDDYQLIRDPAVHALIASLLFQGPEHLHLAIGTREDPPLPIATLRARGLLGEVRMPQLAFTPDESRDFLERALGGRANDETVARMVASAHGWVTALQTFARAASSVRPGADASGDCLPGAHAHLSQTVLSEVLEQQPTDVRQMLPRLSVPEMLTDSLCQVLLGDDGPSDGCDRLLSDLERRGCFLERVPDRPGWYRFHPLLREMLAARLAAAVAPEEIVTLHRRASDWLGDAGQVEVAIHHALAGGAPEIVASIVASVIETAMNDEQFARMSAWVDAVPTSLVEREPWLLLCRGVCLLLDGNVQAGLADCASAERLLDGSSYRRERDAPGNLGALIDTVRCAGYETLGDATAAIQHGQRALVALPPTAIFARATAARAVASARRRIGSTANTDSSFQRTIADLFASGHAGIALTELGQRYLERGILGEAAGCLDQAIAETSPSHRPLSHVRALIARAKIAYERDDLSLAARLFHRALASPAVDLAPEIVGARLGLAGCAHAEGDTPTARSHVEAALALTDAGRAAAYHQAGRVFAALLAAEDRDFVAARGWLVLAGSVPLADARMLCEMPAIPRARVLVRLGDPSSLARALETITDIVAQYEGAGSHGLLVPALVVRATALAASSDRDAARAALDRALEIGRHEQFARAFLDSGPALALLLKDRLRRAPDDEYAADLLARLVLRHADAENPVTLSPFAQSTLRPFAVLRACPELAEGVDCAKHLTGCTGRVGEILRFAQDDRVGAQDHILSPCPQHGGRKAADLIEWPSPVVGSDTVSPKLAADLLTDRELDVLELLEARLSNKEIAVRLVISTPTVKRHAANVYRKLGVPGRRQAVRRAHALSLIPRR